MIKTKKKILLRTLATTAMVATPIATVVSCGTVEKLITNQTIVFSTNKDTGLSMNYKVLTNKQEDKYNSANTSHTAALSEIMEKDTKGSWKFKQFKDIAWKNVQNIGEVTINITLSDYIK